MKYSPAHTVIPALTAALFVATAMPPNAAAQEPGALIGEAVASAVFQSEHPDSAELSEADLKELTLVLELESARGALRQASSIFSFLAVQPVPRLQRDAKPEVFTKFRTLDFRKAAALRWLLKNGAEAQLNGNRRGELLGNLLELAARSAGTETVKTVLALAGAEKIPAASARNALVGAASNAWIFPGTVKALLDAGISCDADSANGGDVLLELLNNVPVRGGPGRENFDQSFDLILKKTTTVSQEVLRHAVNGAWVEGVEKLLAADPRHDAAACMEWLVGARIANKNYPEEAFTAIKGMLTDLGARQSEAVRNLPKIRVYFTGFDEEHGEEPWVSDGTAEGTRMVADLNPGRHGSSPWYHGAAARGLVVRAETEGGVKRMLSLRGGASQPEELLPAGHSDSFRSVAAPGGIVLLGTGSLLWQTDGTRQGTVPVAAGKLAIESFAERDGHILLKATSVYPQNYRGKRPVNRTVYELIPSKRQLRPLCGDENRFIDVTMSRVGDRLYGLNSGGLLLGPKISADGQPSGVPASPEMFMEGRLSVLYRREAMAMMGGHFYFAGDFRKEVGKNQFASSTGVELYRTDGTTAGTSLVADIREEVQDRQGSMPDHFFVLGKTLLFLANDGTRGYRLWSFDGETTRMLHESAVPADGKFTAFGKSAYFVHEKQLWSTDGTIDGTKLIREFNSRPEAVTDAGAALTFSVYDGSNRYSLWRTGGASATTVKIRESVRRIENIIAASPEDDVPAQAEVLPPEPEKEEKLPERKFRPTKVSD